MAIVAVVLFWVIAGLLVFLLAMRAGPRRPTEQGGGGWRTQRRGLFVLTLAAIVIFGVGLPAVVLATHGTRLAKKAPGGLVLTASEEHGRQIFYTTCGECHTLRASNSAGKVGPNLDVLRPPKALVVNAVTMGRANGRGQMPAGLLQGNDLRDVAAYVARVAGHS